MRKNLDPSIAKAERLVQLRNLAKLTRKDIAQMAGVSVLTYKGWENARFGGIPERRAALLIDALQTEGIVSSTAWLIHGTGEQPRKILHHQINQLNEATFTYNKQQPTPTIEALQIKAELEFFCNNNNWKIISLVIPDDAMSPYFLPEDLVAGVRLPNENFDRGIGLNCLVRTKNNKILLRQVQKGGNKGLFTLLCLNQDCKQQFITHDVELTDIAPVLWLRRKSILLSDSYHM